MVNLGIGTVQFGMDYGINNSLGQVTDSEIRKIFSLMQENNISILDTSSGYGSSESAIGKNRIQGWNPFTVSKFLKNKSDLSVLASAEESIKKLNTQKLYGYLIHHFSDYEKDPSLWDEFKRLKKENLSEKIGFSLYYEKEIEKLFLDQVDFDMIQIPYNLFDRRFEKYFRELKERNIEIHTRSVFLQGLFFKHPKDLSVFFNQIIGRIEKIHQISQENNLSIEEIALGFVLINKYIDCAIIGVDSCEMLKKNIKTFSVLEKIKKIESALGDLEMHDEQILLPFNWKIK